MSVNIKDAEEKLGKDRVEEIVEKDWKIADMPTEEELSQEESKSPKARNNPKSRKNLIQYRKKTKEQKEKMVGNLKFVESEEDVIPSDILGKFPKLSTIEKLMPALDVLTNRKEQELYYNYIALILQDFDAEELTASDLDDIVTLAINKVIEVGSCSLSSRNPLKLLESSATIERFRKFSEKIKTNLANRRVDRIDVKNKPAFSIVDLASEIDDQDKADFERRMLELEDNRKGYIPPARDDDGYVLDGD